ncbi:helix-turn-helix transcriptional regulator [Streptomyces sp. NPDC097640]|uniref:helix-turn-helix transcriptional regulator n=1 Tax=Streptomyces sp. NPDC097640 TaxID=3157229 RepID=UPI00332E8355
MDDEIRPPPLCPARRASSSSRPRHRRVQPQSSRCPLALGPVPAQKALTIADAHHISLRHLQQLLAEDDTSPAAWIRHRRLERCRLDLANPRLSARLIQGIAERWGFTNPTHFSRLFRGVYEIPPRNYRDPPP